MLIKFIINKELDRKIINSIPYGNYINVTYDKSLKMKLLDNLDNFYSELDKYKLLKTIESNWDKIEEDFIYETKKTGIFYDLKLKAIGTMGCVYPRWIDKKTFCYPLNKSKELTNLIIAHETLHFFFYEFINDKFKGELDDKEKWFFSEIFNNIVLNSESFNKFLEIKDIPYKEHEKFIPDFKKLYEKNDLIEFFKKGIKLIKSLDI